MGVGGSASHPDRLYPPGKTRYPLYRRLGGPQGRFGPAENLVPTGILDRPARSSVAIPTELPGPQALLLYLLKISGFPEPGRCGVPVR